MNVRKDLRNRKYGSTIFQFACSLMSNISILVYGKRLKFFTDNGFVRNVNNELTIKIPNQIFPAFPRIAFVHDSLMASLYVRHFNSIQDKFLEYDATDDHLLLRQKVVIIYLHSIRILQKVSYRFVSGYLIILVHSSIIWRNNCHLFLLLMNTSNK